MKPVCQVGAYFWGQALPQRADVKGINSKENVSSNQTESGIQFRSPGVLSMFEVRRLARRLWHAPCTARARCFLHTVQEAVELSMLNWSLGGVAAISSEEDFPQMYAAEEHAGPVGLKPPLPSGHFTTTGVLFFLDVVTLCFSLSLALNKLPARSWASSAVMVVFRGSGGVAAVAAAAVLFCLLS